MNGVLKPHDSATAFPLRRVVITNRKTGNAMGRIDAEVARTPIVESTGDAPIRKPVAAPGFSRIGTICLINYESSVSTGELSAAYKLRIKLGGAGDDSTILTNVVSDWGSDVTLRAPARGGASSNHGGRI